MQIARRAAVAHANSGITFACANRAARGRFPREFGHQICMCKSRGARPFPTRIWASNLPVQITWRAAVCSPCMVVSPPSKLRCHFPIAPGGARSFFLCAFGGELGVQLGANLGVRLGVRETDANLDIKYACAYRAARGRCPREFGLQICMCKSRGARPLPTQIWTSNLHV